ncbi:MAG: hypothetical protein U9O24_04705 [Campylobacterota bacterium]|nr:hypothetical protein [Campylobacterota bacterium]
MHIELTPEVLLVQLGYPKNESEFNQMNRIIENTKGFENFSQHILSLNDALTIEKAFIAMSNSTEHLKIKCKEDPSADNITAFKELVKHWADKYKVEVKKVENKNTYYIIGQK